MIGSGIRGINRIPAWMRNKFLLSFVTFLVILFFFDENNIFVQIQRNTRLRELKASKKHLSEQIVNTREEFNLLNTSTKTIEKYAREKYLMKKDNEDLFVISPENITE
jgi:cell division protein FtsB